jgi:hypothetical protein
MLPAARVGMARVAVGVESRDGRNLTDDIAPRRAME